MNSLPPLYRKLRPFLERADALQLQRWPRTSSVPLSISTKSDGSQVTEVDLQLHQLFVSELPTLFPGAAVLSEEGSTVEQAAAEQQSELWIVDPLDGTSRYIRGEEFFGTLLSHRVAGSIEFCAVSLPFRQEFLWAARGLGAFRNGTPLRIPQPKEIEPGSVYGEQLLKRHATAWCSAASCSSMVQALIEILHGARSGAAVRMVRNESFLWDVAPFSLLFSEAGGVLSDGSGVALPMSAARIPCDYLVAGPASIHSKLLALIAAERRS